MQHRLYGLRWQEYVRELKRLCVELRSPIEEEFRAVVERQGKFTPNDYGAMAMKFRLPLTVLSQYLADYNLMPSGSWERLQWRGCKAKDIGVEWN